MRFSELWTGVLYVFDIITFSPTHRSYPPQVALPDIPGSIVQSPEEAADRNARFPLEVEYMGSSNKGPIFRPPNAPEKKPDIGVPYPELKCDYSAMPGFEPCSSASNRSCWLRNPTTGEEYNIETDYEVKAPKGVTRSYTLDIFDAPLNLDGVTLEHGKVFNRVYPGPWITACWGDTIHVTVTNRLTYNGTSVHWHGIRMLNETQMDGVNGVTQCPLAPGDTQNYTFKAIQYGTTWYHSHYSLQYGDGAAGPITIFGPASAPYDEARNPVLVTDWNHRSVFEDWPHLLDTATVPSMTNILFNGKGQYGSPEVKARNPKFEMTVHKGTKYLLRILNTAVDTTFVFAIDDHNMTVIEADLVPIKPYNTSAIVVGIGQRYHVVLHADPLKDNAFGSFWMRAIPAARCSKFDYPPDTEVGILRYDDQPEKYKGEVPRTCQGYYDTACRDEPHELLKPVHRWTVQDHYENTFKTFDVGMTNVTSKDGPYHPGYRTQRWFMHNDTPLLINFSDPTIYNLDKVDHSPWLNIVTENHEKDEAWVWLLINGYISDTTGRLPGAKEKERKFIAAAHPMHLHGHDFALMYQSSEEFNETTFGYINCDNPKINCTNPPRRDVALLPASGFLIIAFKADNPGTWLIHCHIAFHASSGLGIQIVENRKLIPDIIAKDKEEMNRVCDNWEAWRNNPINLWNFTNPEEFQDDSGI